MKEYWVNVYEYPKLKGNYTYSHFCSDKTYAEKLASKWYCEGVSIDGSNIRKTLYRIHVKMKEPKLVSGNEMINRRITGFKISHDWKVI